MKPKARPATFNELLETVGIYYNYKERHLYMNQPTEEQTQEMKLAAEKILFQITEQEEQCLKTIHSRYCLVKQVPIHLDDVSRYTAPVDGHPTYYEYWYKINTSAQAFLMSREIIIKNGEYILQVLFNRELARDGENAADK